MNDDMIPQEVLQVESSKKRKHGIKRRRPGFKESVDELAKDIIAKQVEEPAMIEEAEEISNIVEPPMDDSQKLDPIEKEEKPPEPAKFERGLTKMDAVVISRSEREIFRFLEDHLGNADTDYFAITENIFNNWKGDKNYRYKTVLVEDKYGFRYQLWFDITKLSLVHY